jgi:signal transduction histidine kinase
MMGFFQRPEFDDPLEDQRARVLFTVARFVLLLLPPFATLHVVAGQMPLTALFIYAFVGAFHLAVLALVKRKRLALAGGVYVGGLFTVMATVTTFFGGISAGQASGLIIVTLFAGLALGRRAGLLFGGLTTTFALGITAVEHAGYLPPSPLKPGLMEDASSIVANLIYATVFVSLALDSLEKAIKNERAGRERNRLRAEQGHALGRLGSFAVTAPTLDALAEEAARTVASILGSRAVLVFERRDDRWHLLASCGVDLEGFDGGLPVDANLERRAIFPADVAQQFSLETRVAAAPLPGRELPRGLLVASLESSEEEGVLDFVETVAALVASAMGRAESELQLRQAQKMEVVGRLAGGVAHDFNNLLTGIIGCGALLQEDLAKDGDSHALARDIVAAGERAALMTRQLLGFSRKQVQVRSCFDLNAVVRDFVPVLQRLVRSDVRVAVECERRELPIFTDRTSVEQVLLNLVVNARDSMPSGGQLLIRTRHEAEAQGASAVLIVEDSGSGMDDDTRRRIFEPFFTTKPDGTGLGLSTVKGIVEDSGGSVEVRSQLGVGTAFELRLPLETGVEKRSSPGRPAPRAAGNERVLLVDDDDLVRATTRRALERAGYLVVDAATGALALERLAQYPDVAAIITDVVMPGLGGAALAEALPPDAPGVIFMSGYVEGFDSRRGPLLAKPFETAELLRLVRETIDRRRARRTNAS